MSEPNDELIHTPRDWEKQWQGMPEFIQGKKEPYAKIIVRFASEADLQDFGKKIGQNVTKATKAIWHPTFARGVKYPVWRDETK